MISAHCRGLGRSNEGEQLGTVEAKVGVEVARVALVPIIFENPVASMHHQPLADEGLERRLVGSHAAAPGTSS